MSSFQYVARHRLNQCLNQCLSLAGLLAISSTALAVDVSLPTVEVKDRSAVDSKAYYTPTATAATRTGTPLREVPQAVQVLTRQSLSDAGATQLVDSLDYVSGVARQNNFGGLWDNVAIRGFSGNENTGMSLLRNGFSSNRGPNAPRDLANVESIEFLKGPAAALYGNSEPGGTINIVTKKPQFRSANSLEATAGSYDRYRLALDSTGALSSNLAYRLNIASEDKGSFRDYMDSNRLLVAPALTWVVSNRTILSYDGEYLRQAAPFDRGITMVNGKLGAVPRENFLGNPADGNVTLQNQTHQLTLEHEFSDQWKARLGAAYKRNTLQGWGSEVTLFTDVNNLATDSVRLRRRYRDNASDDLSLQGELQGRVQLAGMTHTLLIGTEAYSYQVNELQRRLNNAVRVDNITSSHPVYTTLLTGNGALTLDRQQQQDNLAVFVQAEISLSERWKLLLGVRHDRFEQRLDNNISGSTARQQDSAVSPRAGLTYLIDPQWSWYVSSGKSFRPNPDMDASGRLFKAEEGKALDTGIKFESTDKRLGASLSLFRIDKKNVLTGSDPDGVFSIAAGEVRSQGVELDLAGKVSDRVRVISHYAYTDTEVTRDSGGAVDFISGEVVNLKGKPLSNVPHHSAGVFGIWEAPIRQGSSWGAGGGVIYAGERAGNYIDSFQLPSYTTVKLTSYWNVDPRLRLSFNVDNLFDRDYIVSSYDRQWVMPGAPRTFTMSAVYKF